jgi:hypothetical protein
VGLAGRSLPVERPAAPKELPAPDDTSWILPAAVAVVLLFGAGVALLVVRRRS